MKKIFIRKVVMKGTKKDHGLGPGVLYKDELLITARNKLWVAVGLQRNNEDLLQSLFEVKIEPKTRKKKK